MLRLANRCLCMAGTAVALLISSISLGFAAGSGSARSAFGSSVFQLAQENHMTNFKLAAIAALALTAAVVGSQVQAGAYDSPYAPTYSSYPVYNSYQASSCPSGQCSSGQCPSGQCSSGQCPSVRCGSAYGAPSNSTSPTYSYSA